VSWHGKTEIADRYSSAPRFEQLAHVNVIVTVHPDGETAHALARTAGRTAAGPIAGEETWSFRIVDGAWRVTSFVYNVRTP
jgi:hypothetical protein